MNHSRCRYELFPHDADVGDRRRHQPAVEVKGATLTGLDVVHAADGVWQAQCVIDV